MERWDTQKRKGKQKRMKKKKKKKKRGVQFKEVWLGNPKNE